MSAEERGGNKETEDGRQETEDGNSGGEAIHNPQSTIVNPERLNTQHPTPNTQHPTPLFWPLVLLLTLVSMGLQWGGMGSEAVIDDHGWLHDKQIRGCSESAWDCFQHPQMFYYYRPLLAVSFVLGKRWYQHVPKGDFDFVLFGRHWFHLTAAGVYNDSIPFRLENLIQHGLAVLLIFGLLRLVFRRDLPALIGGALFALHPLHVPVTTFIGGRTDNMALIFSALFVISLLQIGKSAHSNRTPFFLLWLCFSLLAFTAALFTKEQCVLLVVLAPLLVTLWEDRPEWRGFEWRRLWWLSLYPLPIALYVFKARQVAPSTFFDATRLSLSLRLDLIGRTCWYYFGAFLFPTVDHMHRSTLGPWDWTALEPLGHHAPPEVPTPPSPLIALGGYAALLFALWLLKRTWANRACRFSLLWLFLTLAPCLNIIPVPSQFIAPYRAVIPLVGICGLLGAFFAAAFERGRKFIEAAGAELTSPSARVVSFGRQAAPIAAVLSLAVLSIGFVRVTLHDVPQWHDDLTLMGAELHADLNFVPARTGEAYLYNQQAAQDNQNGEYDKALTNYEKALTSYDIALRQLLPECHTVDEIIQAGRAPDMKRRVASASSLRYNNISYLSDSLAGRGGVEQSLGRWNEAAEDYRAAFALHPADNSLGDWLAYAYDRVGRYTEEENILQAQIARRADSYRLSQLGGLYYRQGRWALARDTLRAALQAPASNTGAVTDIGIAQRRYNEAFVRALPAPLKKGTAPPALPPLFRSDAP